MSPEELRYAKTHEWVHVGEGQMATVGISKFAVEALSDIVFVDLPPIGKAFKAEQIFGQLESVKAVGDLYAPVALQVTEVNSQLTDNLHWLSDDPYGQGWIVKGKITDPAALEKLLDYAAYQKQCAEEGH